MVYQTVHSRYRNVVLGGHATQVSKRGLTGVQADKGKEGGLVIKRELLRGRKHVPQCIYCANKRLCLGYK
jgi:hypothetical protein